jgi:hypothetical protein
MSKIKFFEYIRFYKIRHKIKRKFYLSKIFNNISRFYCPVSSETIARFNLIAVKNIGQ